MKKTINTERIEGRLYEHNLTMKQTGPTSKNPGTEYIGGTIDIAVDDAGLNVVQVHFTYVTAVTSTGKANSTYPVLKQIIESGKTWIEHGPEAAMKLRVDTSLSVNDFYSQDGTLVSAKQNEGGFVTIVSSLAPEGERNEFKTDMLITKVTHVDADPERNIEDDYVVLKGAVFNFRNDLLPVDFIVRNPEGMRYFEDLEVSNSNPVFTKVWGKINSNTVRTERREESAFGGDSVQTFERKVKEWVVTGTNKVPYDFGDETVMTMEDVKVMVQNREVALSAIKKRTEEWRASKSAAPSASPNVVASGPAATNIPSGNWSF